MNSFEIKKNVVKFLIPQTDLFHPVNEYGCNFRSLQAIAEVNSRRDLLHVEIEDLYSQSVNMSWVGEDCYVKEPEQLANSVFKLFKSKYRIWNCGVARGTRAVGWNGKPCKFDYCIIKLWQESMTDKHFVLGDPNFKLLFDPYPNSKSAKLWNVKDIYLYKIFEV